MENQASPFVTETDTRFSSSRSASFSQRAPDGAGEARQHPWSGGEFDRRFAFTRQASFRQSDVPRTPIGSAPRGHLAPLLSRCDSTISIPSNACASFDDDKQRRGDLSGRVSFVHLLFYVFRLIRSGNRPMKRLFVMISLNVAYSTMELIFGLLTGRVGLVSDAFHLTFGCGLLTFSLFAMAASRKMPDGVYTYGYKRLEVLSAFTNALFLLFLSFSLAVEALHAFVQDKSEHNLQEARRHELPLSVLTCSCYPNFFVKTAGLILASWFLTLGVENAEVLCLGLVSVAIFMLVMPLFRTTGSILLQMAPPSIPPSALNKCSRQITSREDVSEVSQARFWELVPGHVVGSISIQMKEGADDSVILPYVHGLYHDLGIQDLTVQTE